MIFAFTENEKNLSKQLTLSISKEELHDVSGDNEVNKDALLKVSKYFQ